MSRPKEGFPATVKALIWERDGGACFYCHRPFVFENKGTYEFHHRSPRGSGGVGKRNTTTNAAANGLLLCTDCHRYVEGFRATALELGLLVSRLGIRRPADIPVTDRDGNVWTLTDTGEKEPA